MRSWALIFHVVVSLGWYCRAAPTPSPEPQPLKIIPYPRLFGTGGLTKHTIDVFMPMINPLLKLTLQQVDKLVQDAIKGDQVAIGILHELGTPDISLTELESDVNRLKRCTLELKEDGLKKAGTSKFIHVSLPGSKLQTPTLHASSKFFEQTLDNQIGHLFHEASHLFGTVDDWTLEYKQPDGSMKKKKVQGYRKHQYWDVYKQKPKKFTKNADFWFVLAIYVRRMNRGVTGDQRYPLGARKTHDVMKTRITADDIAQEKLNPDPSTDQVISIEDDANASPVAGPSGAASPGPAVPQPEVPTPPTPSEPSPNQGQQPDTPAQSSSKGKGKKKDDSMLQHFLKGGGPRKDPKRRTQEGS